MEQRVIPGDKFSLSPWLSGLSPFVVGLFPLVTGDTWHGLAALELSRTAGLLELTLQEQLASALGRVAHESRVRETDTLRRYAADVTQEIALPLAAVSSAHAVIDSKLSHLAEQWMPFVTSLSVSGRAVLSRLYQGLSARAIHQDWDRWPAVLTDFAEPWRLASDLSRLGFDGDDDELRGLADSPDFVRVVEFLGQLLDLPASTSVLGASAAQIARFVDELRRSLL
jgi:hypothetical protein